MEQPFIEIIDVRTNISWNGEETVEIRYIVQSMVKTIGLNRGQRMPWGRMYFDSQIEFEDFLNYRMSAAKEEVWNFCRDFKKAVVNSSSALDEEDEDEDVILIPITDNLKLKWIERIASFFAVDESYYNEHLCERTDIVRWGYVEDNTFKLITNGYPVSLPSTGEIYSVIIGSADWINNSAFSVFNI